jgi:hypothetical protein
MPTPQALTPINDSASLAGAFHTTASSSLLPVNRAARLRFAGLYHRRAAVRAKQIGSFDIFLEAP